MADKETPKTEEEKPAPPFKFDNKMIDKPITASDGHEVLTQEDIDART
jgi:hypothetical protein